MKTITIPVKGMDCASCVRTVEKVIQSDEGVSVVSVNLAAESARIEFDETKTKPNKLISSVINAGYEVPQEVTRFSVQDIDCASCVKSIETWVSSLDGVSDVNVNFATKTVSIQHDTSFISPIRLRREITQLGYTPVPEGNSKEQELAEEKIYKSYRNRLILAILGTLPVFIVSMFMIEFPGHEWMQLVLTSVVVFGAGRGFFRSGFYSLKAKAPNMDVLVSIGSLSAYLYSVVAVIFPHAFHAIDQHPHLYFETAATIITLILTGNLLEKRATAKTSDSLKKLIGMQAKTAMVFRNGEFIEEEIELIEKGDEVLIRPGERIPIDGTIIRGNSSIDQSAVTGEPIPVDVVEGSQVMSGTVNQHNSFYIKVDKANEDSTLSRIIALVKEANGTKAPIQRLADKVSAIFVPLVLSIAMITFISWMFIVDVHSEFAFRYAMMTSVAVMIIACPCAMGLAAPTAVMVGIGRGAQNGMLIRGGEALEKLRDIDTVIFDKTGTITKGEIMVSQIYWLSSRPNEEILRLAASAELPSEHPIAKSMVSYAHQNGIETTQPSSFKNNAGSGVSAQIGDTKVELKKYQAEAKTEKSGTSIICFINEEPSAIFYLNDTIREDAKSAIQWLKEMGIQVVMLTGDTESAAKKIANQIGIDQIIADVLPHQKAEQIDSFQKLGHKVVMVGDGINDAPSLAKAYVGIAMGKGTDIAMESSDVVLLSNSLMKIPQAIELSKKTVLTIKQNLFWAFIYNILAIPIAAGVLWPFYGLLLSPMIGAATMAFSDIFVIGNSILLKYKKIDLLNSK